MLICDSPHSGLVIITAALPEPEEYWSELVVVVDIRLMINDN